MLDGPSPRHYVMRLCSLAKSNCRFHRGHAKQAYRRVGPPTPTIRVNSQLSRNGNAVIFRRVRCSPPSAESLRAQSRERCTETESPALPSRSASLGHYRHLNPFPAEFPIRSSDVSWRICLPIRFQWLDYTSSTASRREFGNSNILLW